MKSVAIILARGGSKGIPNKNIQSVGGIPLVVRTINAALKSKQINKIIVSTDDNRIADVAIDNGVEVVKRPSKISGDTASSELALLDTLMQIKNRDNYVPEIIVFLQCTSPFTVLDDIDGTINSLVSNDADCALAVTKFDHFLWKYDKNKDSLIGVNHDEKKLRKRRQELSTQYLETGSVYVMKTKEFIKYKKRFFGRIAYHVIPKHRVFEIDEPVDLITSNFINSES